MAKNYDVIVIGSGGGSKITRPAANLGLKVAIIEKGALGGTCLNHGCIPSKMLIHPADIASHLKDADKFSLEINQKFGVRFEELITRVTNTIAKDSNSIAPAYAKHPNIDLYPHTAKFISNNVIEVNGEQLHGDKIFIAVGARASIPNIPGLAGTPYFTYKEALRNTTQPKKMIVLGGGYIAVELGYFYAALGTDVTFLVRSTMAKGEDRDVQQEFQETFCKKHDVRLGITPTNIAHDGTEFTVNFTCPKEGNVSMKADALFIATGVTSNADTLALENTDIKVDSNGWIQVDDHLQTAVENVYAFGDVIGRYLFRHNANFEGEYLFQNVFDEMFPEPINYPPMPHAIFSNPQVAGVGETEQELEEMGISYVVGLNPYKSSAMGMALLSESGFCKLLFHRDSKKLLGAHIIGEEASNMIHMCIAYMNMGGTLDDMLRTIYIHPALPEIVRNAARKAQAQLKGV